MSLAGLDPEAPDVDGDATIEPSVGKVGTLFRLRITATEALLQPPDARIEIRAGVQRPLELDAAASNPDGLSWEMTYEARGDEDEGVAAVTATLVDDSGNVSANLGLGNVVFDFTPPALAVPATAAPGAAKSGDTVSLPLSFREPVVDVVVGHVDVGGTTVAWSSPQTPTDTTEWTFELEVDSSLDEGAFFIDVIATDLAGNVAELGDVASFVLDFTAPTLLTPAAPIPAVARPQDVVRVPVELSEAPASADVVVEVSPPGPVFALQSALDDRPSWRFEGDSSVAEGTYRLSLTGVVDAAGNAAGALDLGTLVLDATPPALVDLTLSSPSVRVGDTLRITFNTDEPVDQPPTVSVAGAPLSSVDPLGAAQWAFELVIDASLAFEGSATVDVTVSDSAGNGVTHAAAGVAIDSVPPSLLSASFAPPSAPIGVTAVLTLAASETLAAGPPQLTWASSGNPGFVSSGAGPAFHVFSMTVEPNAQSEGTFELLEVRLVDEAGNVGDIVLPSPLPFAVDNSAPQVAVTTPTALRYSAVAGHNLVSVDFTVSEPVHVAPATLSVSVAGIPLAWTHDPSVTPNDGYNATLLVSPGTPEGTLAVEIRAQDAAGNFGFGSTTIVVDLAAPDIAGTPTLVLTPPPSSPVDTVTALGVGGIARVTFTANEPVVDALDAPQVFAVPNAGQGSPLNLLKDTATGTTFGFELLLATSPLADGDWNVNVVLTDLAGNEATRTLALTPPLVIDTAPPTAPDVDGDQLVVHRRVPWGSEGTGGAPRFTVRGAPGATPGAGTVIVYSDEVAPRAELGRTSTAPDGSFAPIEIPDLATPFLSFVDGAANVSADTVAVREVEWVATTGQKVAGSLVKNPHRVIAARSRADSWWRPDLDELERGDLGVLGDVVIDETHEGRWTHRLEPQNEPGLGGPGAFDERRGALVMHEVNATGAATTWEWAGGRWVPRKTWMTGSASAPVDLSGYELAWDGNRGEVILFGGEFTAGGFSNQTWSWDGESWTALSPSTSPRARAHFAMVWNPGRSAVTLFGGRGAAHYDDTWEWDGFDWSERAVVGPQARGHHTMAYSRTRGAVMHGGRLSTGVLVSDTWAWLNGSWSLLSASSPSLRPTRDARLVHDPVANEFLLFGGFYDASEDTCPASTPCPFSDLSTDDLARFNQTVFERTVQKNDPEDDGWPSRRSRALFVWAPTEGHAMLFGGANADGDGTWAYRAPTSSFEQLTLGADATLEQPLFLYGGMTWDEGLDVPVVFGMPGATSQLWAFGDDDVWTLLSEGAEPAISYLPSLSTYVDPTAPSSGERVLQFGGSHLTYNDRTWLFDGSTWSQSAELGPFAVLAPSLAWDEDNARVFLFGGELESGSSSNELWQFDDDGWVNLDPTGPAIRPGARSRAGLAWDRGRQVLVLFGGEAGATEVPRNTYEWSDASGWSEIVGPIQPTDTSVPFTGDNFHLGYDTQRARVVATYARGVLVPFESWSWDGATWEPIEVDDPYGGRRPTGGNTDDQIFAWDPVRRSAVVFQPLVSTFYVTRDSGPSVTFIVDTSKAQISAGSVVSALEARAVSGGDGTPAPGVLLRVWRPSGWHLLAANSAPAAAPAELGGQLVGGQIDEARWGEQALTYVEVTTAGDGQTTDSRLVVDYVETTLTFRRP